MFINVVIPLFTYPLKAQTYTFVLSATKLIVTSNYQPRGIKACRMDDDVAENTRKALHSLKMV